MSGTSQLYTPLGQEESSECELEFTPPTWQPRFRNGFWNHYILILFGTSVCFNGFLVVRQNGGDNLDSTQYAELKRNVPITWHEDEIFDSRNITVQEMAWNSLESGDGLVAVSDEWAAEKGLPPAQKWPWDNSKSLYYLHGYHNLHCLKVIRSAIMDSFHKRPQAQSFVHVFHCLDAFRQDVICNADDTPRYTGNTDHVSSGLGQARQCKDWSKLALWAKENSACYKHIDPFNGDMPQRERFKFCPDGTQPWLEAQQ